MKYKVLIVDDEKWTRSVISRFIPWDDMRLEPAGEACDGLAGLQAAREMRPNIVITDIKMPEMNGVDMISHLLSDCGQPCVIVVSGYDDYAYMRDVIRLGSVDYLLKPIKREDLLDALARCVQRLDARRAAARDVQWPPEYYAMREDVSTCLSAGNADLIGERLNRLAAFLNAEPVEQRRAAVAATRRSLNEELQKYCAAQGVWLPEDGAAAGDWENARAMCEAAAERAREAIKAAARRAAARGGVDAEAVEAYVRAGWQDGLTLESVAVHFGVSPHYLGRVFHAQVGEGFSDFLVRLRMERARELIVEYRMPLKEVGARVGYSDTANFYKRFKAYFGLTPGEMLTQNDNQSPPN